jgi:hypothetical protein
MDATEREHATQAAGGRMDGSDGGVRAGAKTPNPKEPAKKQVLLRLSEPLWNQIAAWAEDDFRSINGQIEYILSEAVRKR